MHDPRSKTMRIQNEMTGLGLKAYLRHSAANQPRPAALTLCVVCSIGQLTLYITRYTFLFACINSFSYTLQHYCFFRSCYKYPSKSIIIPSKGTLSPTYNINTHNTQTTIRLLRDIDIRLVSRSDLIDSTSDHLFPTITSNISYY